MLHGRGKQFYICLTMGRIWGGVYHSLLGAPSPEFFLIQGKKGALWCAVAVFIMNVESGTFATFNFSFELCTPRL